MALRIVAEYAPLNRKLSRLLSGLADASPLMRIWGEIAHESISYNFEVGGRPKWKPLSAITIKKKGHARPLIGRTRNLSSIVVKPSSHAVLLGTSPAARAYAAIHQYGGMAGRNRKVGIPARPYMVLQAVDIREMREAARAYLTRLGQG